MNILAIIPARSGSKGLKDKNIKDLNGKPLMAYSIEAALKSGIFSTVHVSTDSEKYAEIGREYGADVPFLRSGENSTDKAGSFDAVLEVVEKYKELGHNFDTVMLLQPTSPLRNFEDIIAAYDIYLDKSASCVVSVCEADHSPAFFNRLPLDLSMDGFIKPENLTRRQDQDVYYCLNGAIYMVDIEFLKKSQMLYRKGCYAYIMEKKRSVDIDTELDFKICEFMMAQ